MEDLVWTEIKFIKGPKQLAIQSPDFFVYRTITVIDPFKFTYIVQMPAI